MHRLTSTGITSALILTVSGSALAVVRDNEAKARLPKHGYAVQRRGQRRHSGLKHVDFTDDKRP